MSILIGTGLQAGLCQLIQELYNFMLKPEDKVHIYEIRGLRCQVGKYLPAGCTVSSM